MDFFLEISLWFSSLIQTDIYFLKKKKKQIFTKTMHKAIETERYNVCEITIEFEVWTATVTGSRVVLI